MLTGQASYIDNLDFPRAAYVTFVRSPVAHAGIDSVDAAAARAMPGIIDVILASDLDLPAAPSPLPFADQRMLRPFLASDVVRYVGEPVAIIVSENDAAGVDAAELVFIDYAPLAVVVDPEKAHLDLRFVFPELGTNVAAHIPGSETEDFFAGCDVVVENRLVNQRMAPAPMETRAGAAAWADDNGLTVWSCTQMPHAVRDAAAALYGLAPSEVRVITPDMGGGFGAKLGRSIEEQILPWIAKRVDRPVRWSETRSESMMNLPHARAQVQHAKLGGTRDGTLVAYSLHVLMDCGAYPVGAPFLPMLTKTMTGGAYDLDRVSFASDSVVTNTAPIGAYRGAGRPEGIAAIERMVDIFANRIGMDPAEVRRKNLIPKSAFPYETQVGVTYDSGDYEGALNRALTAAGYDELREEQRRRRASGDKKLLGIGISSYVEITNPLRDSEFAAIEVLLDGSAIVRTGSSSHGQGHETAFAQLASHVTGIPIENIQVRKGDTQEIARGGGTGGSKSLQLGGSAVLEASEMLVDLAREVAAEQFEANPEDIVFDRDVGTFHVVGTPARSRSWKHIAADSAVPLATETDFTAGGPTFPFGAHIAIVEIDSETGRVEIVRFVAVDDAGTIINPLLFEGQVHGGIAAGIGQALSEAIVFDDFGNPLTTTFAEYGILSAAELPSFEVIEMETPTPHNPLGAKGIGESGTVGSTPAIQNAVVDALAHLGVTHIDMPLSPQRIWEAMHR